MSSLQYRGICEPRFWSFRKLAAPTAVTAEDAESQIAAASEASPHPATWIYTHTHTQYSMIKCV